MALAAAYGPIFANLLDFAWQNEFNTYVLAVPLVAGMIAALDPRPWPAPGNGAVCKSGSGVPAASANEPAVRRRWHLAKPDHHPAPGGSLLRALGGGLLALLLLFLSFRLKSRVGAIDLRIFSFVAALGAWAAFALGPAGLRRLAYPLVLLLAMAPLSGDWLRMLESDLQSPSATVAAYAFDLVGESYLQPTPLSFQLPGIRLDVAPECSGIQSTLALAIVSLAAGYLFLPRLWQRIVFTLAAIPLGIFRNALRIVTVGELCSHFGPRMIDSYLHRHGGWIFFAASLGPFFLLAVALQRLSPARASRR